MLMAITNTLMCCTADKPCDAVGVVPISNLAHVGVLGSTGCFLLLSGSNVELHLGFLRLDGMKYVLFVNDLTWLLTWLHRQYSKVCWD